MARKAGLTNEQIVAAAAAVADGEGLAAVTLARVATELGVRPPSLYHHVDGLEGLLRALMCHAYERLGRIAAQARTEHRGPEAVRAQCHAYRTFAQRHPGLYTALNRTDLTRDDPDLRAGMEASVAPLLASLADLGFDGDERWEALRLFRAAIHGFLTLELHGAMTIPLDLDVSYGRLVDSLIAGVQTTYADHLRAGTPS